MGDATFSFPANEAQSNDETETGMKALKTFLLAVLVILVVGAGCGLLFSARVPRYDHAFSVGIRPGPNHAEFGGSWA
jgi:hypothetical protein